MSTDDNMDQTPDFAPAMPPQAVSTAADDAKAEEARLRRIRADPILDKICRFHAGLLAWEDVVNPSIDPTKLPKASYKRRIVPNKWPVYPDPEDIKWPTIYDDPSGKEAANKWPLWGASLHSFYAYEIEMPGILMSAMGTLTRTAAWAKSVGGKYPDWARREIEQAVDEPDPEKIEVYDVNKLLLAAEEGREPATKKEREFVREKIAQYDLGRKALVDLESHRPALPFSTENPSPKLEAPLRMLPDILIVHDPWNTLSINDIDDKHQGDWTQKKDKVRKYRLRNTSKGTDTNNQASCLIIGHEDDAGYVPPPIYATSPSDSLDKHAENKVAHLYLDPTHKKGEGNHSSVFEAELEIPRTLISRPELCDSCVLEEQWKRWDSMDVIGIQHPIKDSWEFRRAGEEVPKAPSSPERGTPGASWEDMLKAKVSEFVEALKSGDPARLPRNVVCGGRFKIARPWHAVEMRPDYVPQPAPRAEIVPGTDEIIVKYPPKKEASYEDERDKFKIQTKIETLDPLRNPVCPHGRRGDTVPIARLRVAAKLSHRGDPHLASEAKAYEGMPKHLSEHWSGYNIRKPLRAPTPLGAVVPQCFGYYVPEAGEGRGQYLSPILLVEDCGDQVTDKRLDASEDERQECADMYLRLHEAGWVHGSVFYRNTVVQKGPLYLPPEKRTMDEPSFRIIDFGRAVKDEKEGHELRWLENEDVLRCFQCGNWSKKQRV